MVRNFQCHSTVPSNMNRFSTKVSRMMNTTAFNPLKINRTGTLEMPMRIPNARITRPNPAKEFTRKTSIIYSRVPRIFVRASSR